MVDQPSRFFDAAAVSNLVGDSGSDRFMIRTTVMRAIERLNLRFLLVHSIVAITDNQDTRFNFAARSSGERKKSMLISVLSRFFFFAFSLFAVSYVLKERKKTRDNT